MSGWLKRIIDPPDLGDPDKNRVARTQYRILLLISVVTTLMLLAALFVRRAPPLSLITYVAGFTLALTCLTLLRVGRPRISGAVLSSGVWALASFAMVFFGSRSPAVLMYVLAILLAGFFWSPRAANGLAVVCVVSFGVLSFMESAGELPAPSTSSHLRVWISVSFVLLLTASILRLGFLGMADALEEARRAAGEARASQTALARSQLQLEEARRLEALGRLAGGVAHDFNNLLTVIVANARAARQAAGEGPSDELLTEIEDASQRASALTSQLLAFGRGQLLSPRALDLSRVVAGMEPLLRRIVGESVQLSLELSEGLAPVRADPSQLEQVVLNLAANARDAVSDGGRVTIQTCVFDGQGRSLPAGVDPADFVALVVTDDGEGMDEETCRSVFEPFFTTKALGRGTGLGLATVHGVVSQSDGHVWAESEPGRGSRFVVILPSSHESVGGAEEVVEPMRSPAREPLGGFVLLVEDDDDVRRVTERLLRTAGLEVLSASTPEEAVALDALERIDVLITDVVMPGMMGTDLARVVRGRRPGLPVVLVSGYSQQALEEMPAEPETWFLRKPYPPEALVDAVRTALGDGARGEGRRTTSS